MGNEEIGYVEGDRCNRGGCAGIIERAEGQGCTCSAVNAPCSNCTAPLEFCKACGWDATFDEESHDMNRPTGNPETPPSRMAFEVSMPPYAIEALERDVITAAALQLIAKFNERDLKKRIEEMAISILNERVNERLSEITREIFDQPVSTPFGTSKEPMTINDFIGMAGRDYLTRPVDHNGNPNKDGYGYNSGQTRIAWLIRTELDHRFKRDMEKAASQGIAEIQKRARQRLDEMIEGEKDRLRKALDWVTSP